MESIVDTFSHVCLEEFDFLVTEFGCKRAVKKEPGLYRVIYRNKTTAVEIGLEWREQYIYVDVYRLVDGKMEENPIVIRPESDLTVFNLEDLIATRAPDLQLSSQSPGKPLTSHDIEKILTDRAIALRDYGRDVLGGDFGVFRELDRIVKRRIDGTVVDSGKGISAALIAAMDRAKNKQDNLPLTLLAYGLNHPYGVISLQEIAQAVPHVEEQAIRRALEQLAEEGLVTRFSGRYCFNKAIPTDQLRQILEDKAEPDRIPKLA